MSPMTSALLTTLSTLLLLTSVQSKVVDEVDEQDEDYKWPVLCPPNSFYSRRKEECLTCSRCPPNKIITSPCGDYYDTECGPFSFHQIIPVDDDLETSPQHSGVVKTNPDRDARVTKDGHFPGTSPDTKMTYSEWRSLTIALIVLVSLFTLAVVAFGVFCWRRRLMNGRKVFYEYTTPPENV